MKFQKVKTATGGTGSGPSSAIGIMRFFDTDSGGPKLSPEFAVILTVVFVIGILLLQFFF